MIGVFVREESDESGEYLGEFGPDQLPQLVKSFTDYPTYYRDRAFIAEGTAVGQYVHDETGVYFEIILEPE